MINLFEHNQTAYESAAAMLSETGKAEELRRTIEKADGLDIIFEKYMPDKHGKYVVFCANREHLDEMLSHVSEWFSKK